ncbi:MAG: hypothetical protein K6T76_09095 [Alicyclobacillus mali]|uniref:hypothetical protein n=1 Tax=Alicyclobacillus mali (ex Roth et al. 2021) TaxID=1123961 RepID=UPI0023F3612C|nr:hypothetical protein [Alicyclobacillus mali (ex Roth et al. 2021)]MCL6489075.1 hypothetical protein [Alicyclobacillus mali (ex Roth et al. 2021)]
MAKIAFLCPREEIVTWLEAESASFPYEVVQDPSSADACVVLAGDEEEAAWAAARIPEGKPVLWFGVLPETPLNLVYHDPELSEGTLDDMLDQAQTYHERMEAEKPKRPSLRRPSLRRPSAEDEADGSETQEVSEVHALEEEAPHERPSRAKLRRTHGEARENEPRGDEGSTKRADIAVGGVTAAWFAWQLAALMERPLFTVVETNDFAAWHAPHAKWQGEPGVVYTGRDTNAIWQQARIRIWVTTLDPAHVARIPAEATHLVVNRVPDGFPVEPEVAIGRKVSLTIPERARSVLRALYQGQPWILHQPQAVLDAWSVFLASLSLPSSASAVSKEEESEWTISW